MGFFARVKFEKFALDDGEEDSEKIASSHSLSRSRFSLSVFVGSAAFVAEREALSFSFDTHLTLTFFACTFLAHQCKTEIGKQQHDGND